MSEYQYYEFRAINRPLTDEERRYVRTLSRRVHLTPAQAIFTYNYGDFPGDPLALLETHFDALLYTANWGSRELAFRFPRALVDLEPLQQYHWAADEITLKTSEQHDVLDIDFQDAEPGDWIEGEGLLAPLLPLRDDILRGDMRALHLAYLKAAQYTDDMDDELDDGLEYLDAEPPDDEGNERATVTLPVPPGLDQLSAPLRAFADFFAIDADLIARAALGSPPLERMDEQIDRWVAQVPDAERAAWLVRLARGEPHLDVQFLRRLREIAER